MALLYIQQHDSDTKPASTGALWMFRSLAYDRIVPQFDRLVVLLPEL